MSAILSMMAIGVELEALIKVWDLGYFEVGEAFTGLTDEHLWQRPAPGLLSVGELAGHVAFWEAVRYGGKGQTDGWQPDLDSCTILSPLVHPHFRYFTGAVEEPLPAELAKLSAQVVHDELKRIHAASVEKVRELGIGLDDPIPGWGANTKLGDFVRYSIFHIAYHTG
ncbi:MAG: DinB family protein, partial [Armatimonadetes bacterium]|nr:DinB family protein [Armatimonadota bacterium]